MRCGCHARTIESHADRPEDDGVIYSVLRDEVKAKSCRANQMHPCSVRAYAVAPKPQDAPPHADHLIWTAVGVAELDLAAAGSGRYWSYIISQR
jgi:hypothetical protein